LEEKVPGENNVGQKIIIKELNVEFEKNSSVTYENPK